MKPNNFASGWLLFEDLGRGMSSHAVEARSWCRPRFLLASRFLHGPEQFADLVSPGDGDDPAFLSDASFFPGSATTAETERPHINLRVPEASGSGFTCERSETRGRTCQIEQVFRDSVMCVSAFF